MYEVREREPRYYEFKYRKGKYRVPAVDSLSLEQVMSFAEAAERGSSEMTKWVIEFFISETDGALRMMKLDELVPLVKEWQSGTDMGESQASSD